MFAKVKIGLTMNKWITWLTDEEAHIISEDWGRPIKEITSQFYNNWQLCQLFQQLPCLLLKWHLNNFIFTNLLIQGNFCLVI